MLDKLVSDGPLPETRYNDEQWLEQEVTVRERENLATARWPAGFEAAANRPYQMCTRTVMDTSDPQIEFDGKGVSHWVSAFEKEVSGDLLPHDERAASLARLLERIQRAGRGKQYDCVIGLSGGVDSCYVAVNAVQFGLRPLIVHFDNGWNSELAVQNIEHIVRKLHLDLQTFVMDWPEFRDLQRSYFRASVLDLEVPTDHMILGALHKVAAAHGIKFILSGANRQTEWLLPRAWYYPKFDLVNLRSIHRTFGKLKLRKLPAMGLTQAVWYQSVLGLETIPLLELVEYDRSGAKHRLIAEFGWRDYGGKHHESVFTRFYQGFILPRKFNVDKRKAHFSNLILAGEMTRAEALRELLKPSYDPGLQSEDYTFVAKKLGFSEDEFHNLLVQQNRAHEEFRSDARRRRIYQSFQQKISGVKPIIRPITHWLRGLSG